MIVVDEADWLPVPLLREDRSSSWHDIYTAQVFAKQKLTAEVAATCFPSPLYTEDTVPRLDPEHLKGQVMGTITAYAESSFKEA